MSPTRRCSIARAVLPLIAVSLLPALAAAQEVRNSSYITSTGERVLRIESTLPVAKAEAWRLFATVAGLEKWIAPVVALNLRVGGEILTNYDKSKSVHDPGTIRLSIVNYLEGEMLTLRVKLDDQFPATVRREDENLQEIIQLQDIGGGRTRVTSSMLGWGVGPEWDQVYAFFAAGNKWTYQQLVASVPQ
jgi:uncharacterized protein YndB with AHSA1/START domain